MLDDELKEKTFSHNDSFKVIDNIELFRISINKNCFFYFSNFKKHLPNLKSMNEFITNNKYIGDVEFHINTIDKLLLTDDIKLKLFKDFLDNLQIEINKNSKDKIGSKCFKPVKISDRLKNKNIKIKDSDSLINQPQPWYVFESHNGTSEEYGFVNFIAENISKLEDFYSDIKLIRNEKAFEIFAIDKNKNGDRFEPDFILMLKNKKTKFYHQIFCEPKGEHLTLNDKWKENLLLSINELTKESELVLKNNNQGEMKFIETENYKLYGLPFYTESSKDEFKIKFNEILKV